MITYFSHRHSKEEKEVPANIFDLPESKIIEQTVMYNGGFNKFHDYYRYLVWGENVILFSSHLNYPECYSDKKFTDGLFKKAASGTVLSFTQE